MPSLPDSFSLKGRNIAIVGATGILGSQYVRYLNAQGANLFIGDIDEPACKALADELDGHEGARCISHHIDLLDEDSIRAFFAQCEVALPSLDGLLNNAQVKPAGFYDSFESYTKDALLKVLDGNLAGVVLSSQIACKRFVKAGRGVIVNISSTYGVVAADQRLYDGVVNVYNPDEAFSSPVSYGISKAGVVQLTRYLASYYRGKNIRVNCLTPGGVFDDHDARFLEQYSSRTLLGRMAERTEYNGAIHYLLSDASSYMTGANLVVDGGWTAT